MSDRKIVSAKRSIKKQENRMVVRREDQTTTTTNGFEFKLSRHGISWTGEMMVWSMEITQATAPKGLLPDICDLITVYCMARIAKRITVTGAELVDFCFVDGEVSADEPITLQPTLLLLACRDRVLAYTDAHGHEANSNRENTHLLWKSINGDGKTDDGNTDCLLSITSASNMFFVGTQKNLLCFPTELGSMPRSISTGRDYGRNMRIVGIDDKNGYIFFMVEDARIYALNIRSSVLCPIFCFSEQDYWVVYEPRSTSFLIYGYEKLWIFSWVPRDMEMIEIYKGQTGSIPIPMPQWATRVTAMEVLNVCEGDSDMTIAVALVKNHTESVLCILSTHDKEGVYSTPFYTQKSPMYRLRWHPMHRLLYFLGDGMDQLVAIALPDDVLSEVFDD
jgi:hypothetical protein